MKKIFGILLIATLGGFIALGLNRIVDNKKANGFEDMQKRNYAFASYSAAKEGLVGFDFVKVAELSTPTVVHIKSTYEAQKTKLSQPDETNPFRDFFGEDGPGFEMPMGPGMATGSGAIISQDGYIITNNHVVENASKIEIVLNDKRTYIADLIGSDITTDLALLKIDESGLAFIPFGNSDDLKVGEWVVAVGNPMNLTSTVTAGIVSAKGRSIDLLRQHGDNKYAIENFIQTDAAINPGNSGGALVNTKGELIGINTAIASQTGSYTGYGFAIPINLAKKIMDDILKYGKVQRGVLGVSIQDITQELADNKGLKDLKGVYVPEVIEGTAAAKSGIKKGDVLLSINGRSINSSSQLQEEVGRYHPGDKLTIVLSRNGESKSVFPVLKSIEGKETLEMAEKKEAASIQGLKLAPLT
ncbi:MAG: trypsin-like peptidase domain-containing protein, partial [Bacteroidia bacterium]|nr:trypsin-like peptidase domain-containing protein [Bacteroidia bacterium]